MLARISLVFILVYFLVGPKSGIYAQSSDQTITVQQKQSLQQANLFVKFNKNDSAFVILQSLLDQLESIALLDSPFGLKAQLAKGQALEQDHQNKEALPLLNKIKDTSEAHQQWETFAKACLTIAQLHQKMHRKLAAQQNIELAGAAIENHDLDTLYSQLAASKAFWHRDFGYPDSVLHFAEQALSTSHAENDPVVEYSMLVLKGWLLYEYEEELQKAINTFRQAVEIAKSIEDYSKLGYVYNVISQAYLRNYDTQNVLLYNDSTITACYKAIEAGHDRIFTLIHAYQNRAKVFKDLNQWDSAYHYIRKGLSQEITFIQQQQKEQVAEIDARYNDEKKTLEIGQLAKEVQQEKKSRNLTIGIALLILVFGSILMYYYIQLRRANLKTNEQAERLKQLDKAKSRFFANVSHELRTPISLILGPIGTVLKKNRLENEDQRLLQMAKQGGQNLKLLINEILDLGKMESSQMELTKEPVRLAAFFTHYFAQFESMGYQNGVNYGYESFVPKTVVAMLDREKCRQIIYNLLSNAFKFTPQGGHVKAVLQLKDGGLCLTVSDTGKGIHPTDLPHVFDRYFQTNRPDAPATGGTGIGLALCKEYTQLFGGKIAVESMLGEDTRFNVEFPLEVVGSYELEDDLSNELALGFRDVKEKPDQFVPPAAKASSPTTDSQKPTILVVEDNPDLQAYIRLILQDQYNVLTADNGQAALDVLNSLPSGEGRGGADLIISDLMMPVMDGYQLLEKLKGNAATHQFPVIMLTARAEKDDRLKALRIGVDDYLTKPFDEEELLVRINNLLVNQSMRKEAAIDEQKEIGTVPKGLSAEEKEWLHSFEEFLHQHLSNNQLSVLMLAEEFAMSTSALLRQLKRLTGLTPQKYIMEMRLDKARQMMAERRFSTITRVAQEIGYSDIRNFSKNFKNRFGKSPSDYLNV